MIEFKNISKNISKKTIINNLSFSLDSPIIYGILGPNGAGKTTTIKLLLGILKPSAGDIKISNTYKNIGYMPEEIGLYRNMNINEHISYFGSLYGISKQRIKEISTPMIKNFNLENYLNKPIKFLSKGTNRKVQFICTVLHSPNILILDEPFSGLDPISSIQMENEIIRFKKEGKIVLISTHRMEQADNLCDHIFILKNGEKILDNKIDFIKKTTFSTNYIIELIDYLPNKYNQWLEEKTEDKGFFVYEVRFENIQSILTKFIDDGIVFNKMYKKQGSLKDIFINLK